MKKFVTTILLALPFCLLASEVSAQAGKWATLKGQFVYGDDKTKVPAMAKIAPSKDVEFCGKNQLFDEQLVINKENRGIANILVWAYKYKGPVHADYKKTDKAIVQMDNISCRFEPHVLTARTGQTLRIGNPDEVAHNSKIDFIKNSGVNPLVPPTGKVDLQLKKAEIVPVTISCSIHPWMQGKLLVQDHPYMAVSDKDGKFEIKHLPAGKKLTLRIWQEKTGWIEDVKIDGKKASWKKGKYVMTMKKDEEQKYVVSTKEFDK